jgi:hypothetical protein
VEVTRRRLEATINAFERAVAFAILQSPNLSKIKRGAEFCCISQNQRSTRPFQEQRENSLMLVDVWWSQIRNSSSTVPDLRFHGLE